MVEILPVKVRADLRDVDADAIFEGFMKGATIAALEADTAEQSALAEKLEAEIDELDQRTRSWLARATCGAIGLGSILLTGVAMGVWSWPLDIGLLVGWIFIVLDVGTEEWSLPIKIRTAFRRQS